MVSGTCLRLTWWRLARVVLRICLQMVCLLGARYGSVPGILGWRGRPPPLAPALNGLQALQALGLTRTSAMGILLVCYLPRTLQLRVLTLF